MNIKLGSHGRYVAVINSIRGSRTIDLHTTDRAKADQTVADMKLEEIERAAVAGAITRSLVKKLATGTVSVKDAVERWYSWAQATYESSNSSSNMLTYLMAWMRETHSTNLNIDEITEDDLDRWINKRDGCKASTRKFRLAVLRSLFMFCEIKGHVDSNIAELCCVKYNDLSHEQKEVRVKRCFTVEEYEKVLAWLRNHIHTLLQRDTQESEDLTEVYRFWLAATIIGRHSALRLSDVATLQWSSIKKDRLIVHTDKRNVRVDLPICDDMRAGLKMIRKDDGKWCWPEQAMIASDPSRRSALPQQFGRILKKAGVSNHHFHELRKTALTKFMESGRSLKETAEYAGHTSENTTRGYLDEATLNSQQAGHHSKD